MVGAVGTAADIIGTGIRNIFGGMVDKKRGDAAAKGYEAALGSGLGQITAANEKLNPYSNQGAQATGLIGSLLGLGGGGSGGSTGVFNGQSYLSANPDVMAEFQRLQADPKGQQALASMGLDPTDPNAFARWHYQTKGQSENRPGAMIGGSSGGSDTSGAEGLARFRESTGYKDTMNAALNGVTSNAAARGLLGSSGTGKIFQNTAATLAQGSFQDYLQNLMGQQNVGVNAAGQQSSQQAGGATLTAGLLGKSGEARAANKGGIFGSLFG